MKRIAIASIGVFSALSLSLALLGALSLVGCGEDPDPGRPKIDAGPGAGVPPMPALGGQIDRMGRPMVSHMLVETFDPDEGDRNQAKDAYNADDEPGTWQADWADQIRTSLAILDGLDSAGADNDYGCTNPLADLGTAEDQETLRYQRLAEILADDRLYLNATACEDGDYLGVETQAVWNNGEDTAPACGGRRPTDDVADITYTTLIVGPDVPEQSLIGDRLEADDGEVGARDMGFPFLGQPHPQSEARK